MDGLYAAALSCLEGFGAAKLRALFDAFGSAEAVWRADEAELCRKRCLSVDDCRALAVQRRRFSIEALSGALRKKEIKLCSWLDSDYPSKLKHIHNPPAVLFYRGDLACLNGRCLAIVGSRKASPYGRAAAETLAAALAGSGVTVVSGAARGIDTASHNGALKNGRTAAVLGCGVDVVYPRENGKLLERIVQEGGVVLTEYPPGAQPLAKHFPARNRIIAGLCAGTIVVEAGVKSGSLITAEFALDEGRDVMAVPGSIFSEQSHGCHKLLKQGAKLVESAADVLEGWTETKRAFAAPAPRVVLSSEEQAIYDALSDTEPLSVDEIIIKTRTKADHIAYLLLQMELKGIVEQSSPFHYVRVFKEELRE